MATLNLSTIARLSVTTPGGTQGAGYSDQPRASSDGRYVVFRTNATDLVTGDGNGALDILWRDTNLTAATSDDSLVRLSVDAAGVEGAGTSQAPSISGDGRYVVFNSNANNLVTGDSGGIDDIFWRDTNLTATTADDSIVRLSVDAAGTQGDAASSAASVSSTGRYVAFQSTATNLVTGDSNTFGDIFWRDTNLTATTADDSIARISVAGATQGDGASTLPGLSGNGRYVVFVSAATNLVTNDGNAFTDIFWRDTNLTATTADDSMVLLSVSTGGTGGGAASDTPAMSSDGRYVVFQSAANNLVAGDTAQTDIFWRDTNLTATTADDSIARLSVAADGTQADNQSLGPSISSDGRYVVFASDATNLVSGDTVGFRDIFWRDTNLTATTSDDTIVRISVNSSATQGGAGSYTPVISPDGSYVVYSSAATNLVTGDTNGVTDVFTIRLGATSGDDTLLGSAQGEIMLGLAGNDTVSGSLGADTLSGGAGNDVFTLVTADGTDTIADWSAGDSIAVTGSTLTGTVATGTGAATAQNAVELNTAGTTLYIGVDAGAGADITINLTGTFTAANFTISGGAVQYVATVSSGGGGGGDPNITTSSDSGGNLHINGSDNPDVINGGQNQDFISAGAGNDTLSGLTGNDTIFGGDGGDLANGNQGNDLLYGGSGNDNLTGEDGADTIYGNLNNDTAFGSSGNDWIHGGQGDDLIYGNTGSDTLSGGRGNDAGYAGQGDDTVYGNLGDDTLFGNSGNDLMVGGEGNDLLSGNSGNDTLSGGEGADRFRYAAGEGQDTITDFSSDDAIEIVGSFGSDAITSTVTDVSTTLAIDIDGDGAADLTIVLIGTFTDTFTPTTSGGVTTLSYAPRSANLFDYV